jgi:hypothetical protein
MTWDGIDRRKQMKDNFQPQTAFEGYVAAKLENIEKKFDELPCKDSFTRLSKVENELSNIKGKATVIGAVFGFIGGWIGKYLYK